MERLKIIFRICCIDKEDETDNQSASLYYIWPDWDRYEFDYAIKLMPKGKHVYIGKTHAT